jgi:tight adherence protein B
VIRARLLAWPALALTAAVLAVPASGAGAGEGIQLTPVGRVPFPDRAYVIDLPRQVDISQLHIDVRENGAAVKGASLTPVGASGIRFGAILAIDSSLSMKGKPFAAALDAARAFVEKRAPSELVGIVTFNGRVKLHQPLTESRAALDAAIASPPKLAYGTHIFDGLERALGVLERNKISAGSIVLLSDGADVGSTSTLEKVIDRAKHDRVRDFTVGLKSNVFEALPLNRIATATGGSFTAATSTSRLAQIYAEISGRLASEYLLQYRSTAKPGSAVQVTADIRGLGAGAVQYTTPSPSGLKPFHRSLASRFFLSPLSLVLIALFAAALVGGALLAVIRMVPSSTVTERIGAFGAPQQAASPATTERRRRVRTGETKSILAKWWIRLDEDFEIGEITTTPQLFTLIMVAGTLLAAIILTSIAGPLILLAALVPVFAMSWVKRRVKRVRNAFADQLPETLQLLASALRSGHSLIGALKVVVESAPEPVKREFSQIVTDDQIGLPIEESARRVAARMKSRDMVQVALIAELQRTAGGNAADVLDSVVATVRERADVRRLAQTLTVQGRMARWILSILPVVLALLMLAMMPKVMKPLFVSSIGQIALVFAALLVVAGSFWIQKIVEIEV